MEWNLNYGIKIGEEVVIKILVSSRLPVLLLVKLLQ